MQRSWLPRTLVLAAVMVAPACGRPSSNPPLTTQAARWCEETPVLIIHNNSGGDVEIRESRSGARVVIAMLGAGRHEISIRGESGYSYSAAQVGGGTVLSATSRPRVRDHAVTLERECRER
jgi:hypothetical protein